MIKKYVKKPVTIEAIQWTGGNAVEIDQWCNNGGSLSMRMEPSAAYEVGKAPPIFTPIIHTLEGDMIVSKGDYIIKGVHGEFYPCKPDIFMETYEEVEG